MPYSITTKDGITINNIPDDVDPHSQQLKDRVAQIRASHEAANQPQEPASQPILRPTENLNLPDIQSRGYLGGLPLEQQQGAGPIWLPQHVTTEYVGNRIPADQRAQLERDIQAGIVKLRPSPESQIPTGEPGWSAPTEQGIIQLPKPQSIGDKILGIGEAGLSAITGATTGAIGDVYGSLKGIAQSVRQGTYGTQQGVEQAQEEAAKQSGALTYAPKTEAGQQYTEALGKAMEAVTPIAPMAGELSAMGSAVKAAKPQISAALGKIPSAASKVAETVAPAAKSSEMEAVAVRPKLEPMSVAPKHILESQEVRARPSNAVPNAEAISGRNQVMDAIGIPENSRRLGAETGNRTQIQKEISMSKLDGGDKMRQQLDMESQKLGEYGAAIQRDTGGTVGATPLQRGETISAPLEDYQNWYKDKINTLYKAADQVAAQQGKPIELGTMKQVLDTSSVFAGKAENASIRRGLKAYLKEQGVMDAEGNMKPVTAVQAEKIKQYLNSQWSPQTSGLIGKIKGTIDDDVMRVFPEDIYKKARTMRHQYAQIFDDPKGMAKILDISGPDGINRAISLDTLPDAMANWASKNSAQFNHVVRTLENLPTPELRAAGKQAIAEIRSHLVERMLGKNIDPQEAALGNAVWKGTDDSLNRAMLPYRGKMEDLLGKELADRMETLKVGARILKPLDPNPSGTATTALNLQSDIKRNIARAGGAAIGATAGTAGGGIGAVGGAVAGEAFARKMMDISLQRAIDKEIARSLERAKKAKPFEKMKKEESK